MAEEKPSLHIDNDWKKQAQEEKRRLAEQEQQAKAAVAPAGLVTGAGTGPGGGKAAASPGAAGGSRQSRELPPPSIANLIQSVVTQILYYLGEIGQRGAEPTINLDMAKYQIDTLNVLEEKTRGNLTAEEQSMLDAALYEVRMRFINVGTQYAQLP